MAQFVNREIHTGGFPARNLPPGLLEIDLHHTDGSCTHFSQSQPSDGRSLLDNLHPDKVFHQPQIYIADENTLNVYQTSSIAWIEVVMQGFPDWHFPRSVARVENITEAEFQTVLSQLELPANSGMNIPITQVVRLELSDGKSLFHRLQGSKLTAVTDMNMALKGLLHQGSCILAQNSNGAILVNAANVRSMHFHPRSHGVSSAVPAGTWPAQKISFSSVPSADPEG